MKGDERRFGARIFMSSGIPWLALMLYEWYGGLLFSSGVVFGTRAANICDRIETCFESDRLGTKYSSCQTDLTLALCRRPGRYRCSVVPETTPIRDAA